MGGVEGMRGVGGVGHWQRFVWSDIINNQCAFLLYGTLPIACRVDMREGAPVPLNNWRLIQTKLRFIQTKYLVVVGVGVRVQKRMSSRFRGRPPIHHLGRGRRRVVDARKTPVRM